MIWIFPMAGKGTRTQTLGEFKPFIEINGLKILNWFLLSIKNNIRPDDRLIFITTDYFAKKYKVKHEIKQILESLELRNNFKLITCPSPTAGPSATVYSARANLLTGKPLIVVNPDQYLDFQLPKNLPPKSGFMTVYAEFSHKTGYVRIINGLIKRFVEKKNISNLGSAGVFLISDGKALIKALENQFAEKIIEKGEYYIGPAFNYLIRQGYKIYPLPIMSKYDLGNIEGINRFTHTPIVQSR